MLVKGSRFEGFAPLLSFAAEYSGLLLAITIRGCKNPQHSAGLFWRQEFEVMILHLLFNGHGGEVFLGLLQSASAIAPGCLEDVDVALVKGDFTAR